MPVILLMCRALTRILHAEMAYAIIRRSFGHSRDLLARDGPRRGGRRGLRWLSPARAVRLLSGFA